jgi:hypothetical protein
MTPAATALLATYEAAARSAQAAEEELRKRMAAEVARLERQRAFAFRRTRLIRTLAQHAGAAETKPEEAWLAQRHAVRNELGWSEPSDAHDRILAHLEPVATAVRSCANAEAAEGAPKDASAAVQEELAAFEAWFEEAHGTSFYALFDQYFPEVPVVDF